MKWSNFLQSKPTHGHIKGGHWDEYKKKDGEVLAFGDAVMTDANGELVKITDKADWNKFFGIVVDTASFFGLAGEYKLANDHVPVLTSGEIYLKVSADVKIGQVQVEKAGVTYTAVAKGGTDAFSKIEYLTNTTSGDIATVKVGG